MKRRLPLTLPDLGSTYPYDIDGRCELYAVEAVSLGRGIMDLRALAAPHKERPTFINDVVRMVRPNDAAAWLPLMREHYSMDDEGRAALIAEANQAPRTVEENLAWVDSLYAPMVVCHNGEDLARAFPQVDTDLMKAVDAWHAAGENTDDLATEQSIAREAADRALLADPVFVRHNQWCEASAQLARQASPPRTPIRDLYATIGGPVPALVWPRQESEQSPTHSETPDHIVMTHADGEPGMPNVMRVEDFAVGDRVTVAKKVETLSNGRSAGWESKWMDETVGQQGRVNDAVGTRVLVQLDDGCEYAYAPEALALENACSEVPAPPEPAKPRTFNVGDLVTVQEIEADNGYRSAGVSGALGAVLRLPMVDHRYYIYISKEQGGWFSPEALEPTTVHATMNELNAALVAQGRRYGAAWATEPSPVAPPAVEVVPAKPHVFKTGERVIVARKVERDSTGHWCFWPKFVETLGLHGVVLPTDLHPEGGGATVKVDLGDMGSCYYSPEALDLVTPAE